MASFCRRSLILYLTLSALIVDVFLTLQWGLRTDGRGQVREAAIGAGRMSGLMCDAAVLRGRAKKQQHAEQLNPLSGPTIKIEGEDRPVSLLETNAGAKRGSFSSGRKLSKIRFASNMNSCVGLGDRQVQYCVPGRRCFWGWCWNSNTRTPRCWKVRKKSLNKV